MQFKHSTLIDLLFKEFSKFFDNPSTITQIKDLMNHFMGYMKLCDSKITLLINHINLQKTYWSGNSNIFDLKREIKNTSSFITDQLKTANQIGHFVAKLIPDKSTQLFLVQGDRLNFAYINMHLIYDFFSG